MAVTIYSQHEWIDKLAAIERKSRRATRHFWGVGSENDTSADVEDALDIFVPQELDDLIAQDADIRYLGGLNESLWDISVSYVHKENEKSEEEQDTEDENRFSFQITSQNLKITTALEHISSHNRASALPADPQDFRGAINVTEKGVEGVDIKSPAQSITITRVMDNATVSASYRKKLAELCGTVNDDSFLEFATGEALFTGCTGNQRPPKKNRGDWVLSFTFDIAHNESGVKLAEGTSDEIDIGFVEGHDYVWVAFKDFEDTTAKTVVKRPVSAYVERVYKRTDFNELGLE